MFNKAFSLLFFALLCTASASFAFGQSYVSSAGNDANPCDAANPCRTVNRALAAAGVGGTALLADAGPYDAFVITRSARVVAVTGAAPRIIAPDNSTPAIKVALPPDEYAYLEGLIFNTAADRATAVSWVTPSKLLWMKNCQVYGFLNGLSATAGGNMFVDTCAFNGGGGGEGIGLETSSETEPIYSTIQYTDISGYYIGAAAGSNTDVGILGSRIFGCNAGVMARALNADLGGSDNSRAYVTVTGSWVYGNSMGLIQDWTFSSVTRTVLRLGYNRVYSNSGAGIWGGCDLGGNAVFGNGWTFIDDLWRSGRAPACAF